MATVKQLVRVDLTDFPRLPTLAALCVLLFFNVVCRAQGPPGHMGQAAPQNVAAAKTQTQTQTETGTEDAKAKKTAPSTEEWLESIERTYKHSQEDLTGFIEIIHTVFEVLAAVLVIFGLALGYDISKLRSQLRHQREAQEDLERSQKLKYDEFTAALNQKLTTIQEDFNTQVQGIEQRLGQFVKNSTASVFATQGLVLRVNNHIPESIKAWDDAISQNPLPYYYWQRAYTLEIKSQFAEAMDDCDTAVRLQPDYLEPRMLKGYLLIKQQKFSEAIAELEAVLKKKPDDTYTIFNLAVSYGGLQDRAKVLEWLMRLKCYSEFDDFLGDARKMPQFVFLKTDNDFKALVV